MKSENSGSSLPSMKNLSRGHRSFLDMLVGKNNMEETMNQNPGSSSLILLVAFCLSIGCQTPVEKGEQAKDVVVRPVTEIPTEFAMSFAEEDGTQLITVSSRDAKDSQSQKAASGDA